MITVIAATVLAAGILIGLIAGRRIERRHNRDALKLIRYQEAIGLLGDLVMNPDAATLRPRAADILAADHAAKKEN